MRISNKEIAFVCCYFNPCNYQSRFLNFILFLESVKKYKVNLVVVEAYSSNSKYRINKLHDNIISIRTEEVYWMKENLLNIGIEFLLDYKIKNIGWLDCDILINDSNFLEKTITSLKTHKVVHMFSECKQWLSDTLYKNKTSVCKLSHEHNNLLTLLLCRLGDVGYGYAYNSDILRKVLLYDKAVVGTGDWLNLLGCIRIKNHEELMGDRFFQGTTRGFFNSFIAWQKCMSSYVDSNVGYVDTTFEILHHGNELNRDYVNRESILKKCGYEPNQHLINFKSTYKLQNRSLSEAITDYFISRDEDYNISTIKRDLVDDKIKKIDFYDNEDELIHINSTSDYLKLRRSIHRSIINYNTQIELLPSNNETRNPIKYAIVISGHTDVDIKPTKSRDTDLLIFRKSGKPQKDNILVLSHEFSVSHTYLSYIIKNYSKLPEFVLFCNDIGKRTPSPCVDVFDDPCDAGFAYMEFGGSLEHPNQIQMEKSYISWQHDIVNSRKRPLKNSSSSFLVSCEKIHTHPLQFYKELILMCDKYNPSQVESYFEKLWARLFS